MKVHSLAIKAQQVALHPRTQAMTEVAYAAHGLLSTNHWLVYVIFGVMLVVGIAHILWATAH